jgi:hypothetical protein
VPEPEPDPDGDDEGGRTVLGVATDSSDVDNDDAVEPKEQLLALFPVFLPFLEEGEAPKKLVSFMVSGKERTGSARVGRKEGGDGGGRELDGRPERIIGVMVDGRRELRKEVKLRRSFARENPARADLPFLRLIRLLRFEGFSSTSFACNM